MYQIENFELEMLQTHFSFHWDVHLLVQKLPLYMSSLELVRVIIKERVFNGE